LRGPLKRAGVKRKYDKMSYIKVCDMIHRREVLKNGRFINGNGVSKILKKNCKSTNERKKKKEKKKGKRCIHLKRSYWLFTSILIKNASQYKRSLTINKNIPQQNNTNFILTYLS
jgi:hypothetical protein